MIARRLGSDFPLYIFGKGRLPISLRAWHLALTRLIRLQRRHDRSCCSRGSPAVLVVVRGHGHPPWHGVLAPPRPGVAVIAAVVGAVGAANVAPSKSRSDVIRVNEPLFVKRIVLAGDQDALPGGNIQGRAASVPHDGRVTA